MLSEWNAITERVIGCAIAVHRGLGPGLLESVYDAAMCIEMDDAHLRFEHQVQVPATYKGRLLGHYRLDFIVEKQIVVELKAISRFDPLFEGQLLTYLRVTGLPVGLLLNFHARVMTAGIKRYILTPSPTPDLRP